MARSFVTGSSTKIVANAAHLFLPTNAFSVSLWVNGAALTTAGLYTEGNNASTRNFFVVFTDSTTGSHARIEVENNSGILILDITSTATICDATWHHVCYTQDASANYALYIDGSSDKSGSYTPSTFTTPNLLTIGALGRTTYSNFFTGVISEVANWSRQLNAGEVKSLAAGLPASHLGPNHYWPLLGRDSPEPDYGTAANVTGTLTGTAFASGGRVSPNLLTL